MTVARIVRCATLAGFVLAVLVEPIWSPTDLQLYEIAFVAFVIVTLAVDSKIAAPGPSPVTTPSPGRDIPPSPADEGRVQHDYVDWLDAAHDLGWV